MSRSARREREGSRTRRRGRGRGLSCDGLLGPAVLAPDAVLAPPVRDGDAMDAPRVRDLLVGVALLEVQLAEDVRDFPARAKPHQFLRGGGIDIHAAYTTVLWSRCQHPICGRNQDMTGESLSCCQRCP